MPNAKVEGDIHVTEVEIAAAEPPREEIPVEKMPGAASVSEAINVEKVVREE